MKDIRQENFVALASWIICSLLILSRSVWAQGQPITFSAIGDIPYGNGEISTLEEYVEDNNLYSPSRFFIHLGDINAGSESCNQSRYVAVANILKDLNVPAFIIPGDNEWLDCSNPSQAWDYWEDNFSDFEDNFCLESTVEHQSGRHENFAFLLRGVLFAGINIPAGTGGNDNQRLQDDADWVDSQLSAKKSQVRGAVIFGHAGTSGSRNLFFNQFRESAVDFDKPILYLMGDKHTWSVDTGWLEPNITRVIVNRGGREQPVEVTVTMDSNDMFELRRNPWSSNSDVLNFTTCNLGPTPVPEIASFGPDNGATGTQVIIDGDNFNNTSQVSFNGTEANDFSVDSNTQISVTVPGVATTGPISVVTPGGTATSSDDFTIIILPTPNSPSGLTANATGSSTIDLAWNDNSSDEDGFKVERKTGSGSYSQIVSLSANDESFTDTNLDPSTSYTYRVRANNGSGDSGYSNEASATTTDGGGDPDPSGNFVLNRPATASSSSSDKTPNNAVDGNTGSLWRSARVDNSDPTEWIRADMQTTRTVNQVIIRWKSSYFATDYLIQISTDDNSWTTLFSTTNGTGGNEERNFASGTGRYLRLLLTSGNSSNYRINEFEAYGDGTGGSTPPDTPGNLSATATGVSTIDLNWQDNSGDEDGFNIERKTGAGAFSPIASVGADVESYNDSGLNSSTKYTYRVNAFNTGGNSNYSNEPSATTSDDASAPAAPTNLAASASGSSQINIAWDENSNNEDGFKVERKTGSGSFSEVASLGANVELYNDTGLDVATVYTYRVRAFNNIDNSGYTNEASATTSDNGSAPAAPTNLAASASGSSQINIAWDENSNNEDGFKVERKAGSGSFSEVASLGADVELYNDTGLDAATVYTYRVRAFNSIDNSAYSNEASATTSDGGGNPDPNTNLALNQPIVASSFSSDKIPENTVDGNNSTLWRSGKINSTDPTEWLRIDLQNSVTVSRVIISWKGSWYASNYQFQVSADDQTWTTVYTTTTGTGGTEEFIFQENSARYARVLMTAGVNTTYRIIELSIFSGSAPLAKAITQASLFSRATTDKVTLGQNYPNPFNPTTVIPYFVHHKTHVTIEVVNLVGQKVVTLINESQESGVHKAVFDASGFPTGNYFSILKADGQVQVRRLVFMK